MPTFVPVILPISQDALFEPYHSPVIPART